MGASRDLPDSIQAFARRFGDEGACARHLAELRWPHGFRCQGCGGREAWQLVVRPRVFECRACGKQVSVTSGTVMHRSKVSLVEWFWAAWSFAQDKRGVSALHLSRVLGRRYETVWKLLHKVRAALAEDDAQFPLVGTVEVDEAYLGGKSCRGKGGRSLKDHRRALVVGAVERLDLRGRNPGVRGTGAACGSTRFVVAPNASQRTLVSFLQGICSSGTTVATDGWSGYGRLEDVDLGHLRTLVGRPELASEVLPLIHTLFANLRAWVGGTFHGVSRRWLSRYLQEFTYRLNRRYHEKSLWHYVLRRFVTRPWVRGDRLEDAEPALAA
jgi:hypothetical protein